MYLKSIQTMTVVAMVASPCVSFTPLASTTNRAQHHPSTMIGSPASPLTSSLSMASSLVEPPMSVPTSPELDNSASTPSKTTPPNNKKKPSSHGKSGILSPMVVFVKTLMDNDTQFNKLRAKAISLHSDVISSFCETADTPFGNWALETLFEWSDQDDSGTIDRDELASALRRLGFEWLQDKQVSKIFQRADQDENGFLDLQEWSREAPKTLRTNLIKLAKKNGGELGLLV